MSLEAFGRVVVSAVVSAEVTFGEDSLNSADFVRELT